MTETFPPEEARQEEESFADPFQQPFDLNGHHINVRYGDDWPEIERASVAVDRATWLPPKIKEDVDAIFRFLRLPVVEDDFDVAEDGTQRNPEEAHALRREWEQGIDIHTMQRLNLNILGGGNLGGLIPLFDAMKVMSGIPSMKQVYENTSGVIPTGVFEELSEKMVEIRAEYEGYKFLSVPDKLAFMYKARAFFCESVIKLVEAYGPN